MSSIDSTRIIQLLTGIAGIYVSYLVTGIVHQSMLKEAYTNDWTGAEEKFKYPSAFLIFPCAMTWLLGELINKYQIRAEDRTYIPAKNAAMCGVTVAISTLTYTYAIYLTNYPVVMMFKSCNILSVILVGVLCSGVKNKGLKLGPKKIVVGVLVTLGIVLFKYFDPEGAKKEEKKTEILGIVLLVVSMLADGFLPDFQAVIKTEYKPLPMQMMTAINKWVTIISLIFSLLLWQFIDICAFMASHRLFLIHMLIMGILAVSGQMFVYRMIKQFKQHFVPFVITTRKIFTVALSIVFYNHETNFMQVLGIVTVFGIVAYQFVTDLMEPKVEEVGAAGSANQLGARVQMQEESIERGPASPSVQVSVSDQVQREKDRYEQRLNGDHAQIVDKSAKEGSVEPVTEAEKVPEAALIEMAEEEQPGK